MRRRLNCNACSVSRAAGGAANQATLEDLVRSKRELKQETAGWDDTAHRGEVEAERTKRTAAATHAAEIASAIDAAKLARERATLSRKAVDDRAKAIAELVPLELQLTE